MKSSTIGSSGAAFHELDLVGPDPKAQGTPAEGVHCDADVVGNVLVVGSTTQGTVARLGSDGTGASRGRCRFANNTVIVRGSAGGEVRIVLAEGGGGFGIGGRECFLERYGRDQHDPDGGEACTGVDGERKLGATGDGQSTGSVGEEGLAAAYAGAQ